MTHTLLTLGPYTKTAPFSVSAYVQGTPGAPSTQAGCLAWLESHGVTTTATAAARGLDGLATRQGFEAAVAAAGRWMQQRESLGECDNCNL
jgi:hypothetical protein